MWLSCWQCSTEKTEVRHIPANWILITFAQRWRTESGGYLQIVPSGSMGSAKNSTTPETQSLRPTHRPKNLKMFADISRYFGQVSKAAITTARVRLQGSLWSGNQARITRCTRRVFNERGWTDQCWWRVAIIHDQWERRATRGRQEIIRRGPRGQGKNRKQHGYSWRRKAADDNVNVTIEGSRKWMHIHRGSTEHRTPELYVHPWYWGHIASNPGNRWKGTATYLDKIATMCRSHMPLLPTSRTSW